MSPQTLYWYDYETFGIDPMRDRPVQFAGIRTDWEFNPIGDPLVLFCKPANDTLPQPEACLITGITPKMALREGICEAEFIAKINHEFSQPNTCVLGYNNIRFDDEITRNTLYRNFFDPYKREWQGGNSRWDLIDIVRLAGALRPSGIEWPINADGIHTFRLDQITVANGIEHSGAHDALADVFATIALAKLLKLKQSKLYEFVFRHRGKSSAAQFLNTSSIRPVIHASEKYGIAKHCIAVVAPVAQHPTNQNSIIVYDLMDDVDPLIELNPQEIRQRVFTPRAELPEGVERLSLKAVHLNRCPVLVPVNTLGSEDAKRLQINAKLCMENLEKIKSSTGLLANKIQTVFADGDLPKVNDPDMMLYSGGFFSDHDRLLMDEIRSTSPDKLNHLKPKFHDSRLSEMLFRYQARNFPESLSSEDGDRWESYRRKRLTQPKYGASIVIDEYCEKLRALRASVSSEKELAIVEDLEEYGNNVLA